PKPERGIPLPVQPLPTQPANLAKPKPKPPQPELPLQAVEPSQAQLQRLLEAWLQAKAAVLAGQAPALPPRQLAVASLVAALDQDRQADLDRGETQTVTAKVTGLEIGSRSPERIEAKVSLLYGDERRSQAGKLLEQTPEGERHNTYVFGRNQKTWKLERVIFQASRP
ncbi:MAG: IMS domain-containing protein, partial [Cyanobacteria bacterium]|nr:IMS domain-containing protein [Cyanobacteriota bacterium]